MRDVIVIEAAGKVTAWERGARAAGLDARVVFTSGHLCSFPGTLFPLGISLRGGKIDSGRVPDPAKASALIEAFRAVPEGGRVLIACDDDVEGDVIAFDVIELLIGVRPELAGSAWRVVPHAMTDAGIARSLEDALRIVDDPERFIRSSVPGRTRAVTDRWIGGVMSRMAGTPVGRVRSSLVGSLLLSERMPEVMRGGVETGEILFRARSLDGGSGFMARVPVYSDSPRDRVGRLTSLARRFAGRSVPGGVRALASLSAAVAPRFGNVAAFSTGDAVAHAARHHGISPAAAMRGLQDAYMRGDVSYVRTDSRAVGPEAAASVSLLAGSCGVRGVSAARLLSFDAPARAAHQGLHPLFDGGRAAAARFRDLVRGSWADRFPADGSRSGDDPADRKDVAALMTALVARRAMEAGREVSFVRGNWRTGNDPDSASLSMDDRDLLEDLDWEREEGAPPPPWSRDAVTGARAWPRAAVMVDLMMTEGLGRPSTFASHILTAETSGEIEPPGGDPFASPDPYAMPRLTPLGRDVLRRTPRDVWTPAAARMIAAAIDGDGGSCEPAGASMDESIRFRVAAWLEGMTPPTRDALIAALEIDQGGRAVRGAPLVAERVPAREVTRMEGAFAPPPEEEARCDTPEPAR